VATTKYTGIGGIYLIVETSVLTVVTTSTDTSVEDKSTVMDGKKSTGIGGNDVY
jgi:hypothetical protein